MIYNVSGNYFIQCDMCQIEGRDRATNWTNSKDVDSGFQLNLWPKEELELLFSEAEEYGWKCDRETRKAICPRCQSAIESSFG